MYYKIASILLNNKSKADIAGDIFIAQPDSQKEALVGKLFILAEIQAPKPEAEKILAFLIGNLNFNYYQNEKVILREKIESITLENIFESALTKTNKDLAEFLSQEKIKISPYGFNVAVCVLYQNDLFLSGTGKIKNLLVYKEKTTGKIKGNHGPELEKIEYKISDVGASPETEALDINKLFSSVTSGKIPVNGYFLAVNEALSEYLSHKQLIKIITKLSPAGAAEQIRNLLEQVNSYVSFLGIIIKNTISPPLSGEDIRKKLEEETVGENYQPEITATEEKTEKIMTPSGLVNLKKWSKAVKGKAKPARAEAAGGSGLAKKMFLLKEKIFFKKRTAVISLEKTKNFFFRAGKISRALFIFVYSFFAKNKAAAEEAAPGRENKPLFWSGRKIKMILAAALILIAIFGANLYFTDKKNKAAEKLKAFNALVAEIEKNQNKIEADFLYGNETEINELFRQNSELLKKIPQAEIDKREAVKSLFSRQAQELEKIRRITKISGLKKIADFSNLLAAADPQNLLLSGDLINAADGKNAAVFKVDLKENMVTAVYSLGIASGSAIVYPTAGQNGNIYYLNDGGIMELDKNDKATILKIALPSSAANVGGFKAYSDKLYILDGSLSQIFRFARAADGFADPIKWLNQDADLTGASDIFIDGNLYVLFKDGRVDKYLKGKKQELALGAIDPAITGAGRLIVTPDYFYILETAAKRLSVWSEKGAYLGQYIFTDLNSLKDFAVNEKDKKIYFLAEHSVYEMDMPVLK
jgi:hypothetical protein